MKQIEALSWFVLPLTSLPGAYSHSSPVLFTTDQDGRINLNGRVGLGQSGKSSSLKRKRENGPFVSALVLIHGQDLPVGAKLSVQGLTSLHSSYPFFCRTIVSC